MIQKVSDISVQDVADFIRLGEMDDKDKSELSAFLCVAKDYIKNYTGLTDLDEYSDFVIAVLVLCQDMYDHRSMYVEKGEANKVVQTILDMHTVVNL